VPAQALLARALVSGDTGRARQVRRVALVSGVGCGVLTGTALFAGRDVLPRLFTSDPATLASVALVWPFVWAVQPLNTCAFVVDGLLYGAKELSSTQRTRVGGGLLYIFPCGAAH